MKLVISTIMQYIINFKKIQMFNRHASSMYLKLSLKHLKKKEIFFG